MAHFEITHSAFFDARTQRTLAAGSLLVNGTERAADLIRRLAANGATDAKARELTPAEHVALVRARMPKLEG